MNIEKKDLQHAAENHLITEQQADRLWDFWNEQKRDEPGFNLVHLLYYAGALLIILAMGWYMGLVAENEYMLALVSGVYFLCFIFAGKTIWYKEKLKIPGGLLFTVAVCIVPLFVYAVQKIFGFWPQGNPGKFNDYHVWVKGSWIVMETATIITGCIILRYIRFPFITAPVAFSLWYMSMDLTPILFGMDDFNFAERRIVSLFFGLCMLIVSYYIDRRTREDYAFWLYLFGASAFWGGLSTMSSDSEMGKFIYFLINIVMIGFSILLQRRIFIIFGSFGTLYYIGHLAYTVFKGVVIFPFALCLIGVGVIFLAVKIQKNREIIDAWFLKILPEWFRENLPRFREQDINF